MTFLVAVICLIAGLCAGFFALKRPKIAQSLDVAVDTSDTSSQKGFTLANSLLLIGPEMNDLSCNEQRRELKRILEPLLQAHYKIIELYGSLPPAENGEPYEWLDNQLLRETLSAEEGFHLIYVDKESKTAFHSGKPVVAEALLHIFDLWDYITEDTGEDLTTIDEYEAVTGTQEEIAEIQITEEPTLYKEPALTPPPILEINSFYEYTSTETQETEPHPLDEYQQDDTIISAATDEVEIINDQQHSFLQTSHSQKHHIAVDQLYSEPIFPPYSPNIVSIRSHTATPKRAPQAISRAIKKRETAAE